jgi:hypothetical protein
MHHYMKKIEGIVMIVDSKMVRRKIIHMTMIDPTPVMNIAAHTVLDS